MFNADWTALLPIRRTQCRWTTPLRMLKSRLQKGALGIAYRDRGVSGRESDASDHPSYQSDVSLTVAGGCQDG